MVDTMGKKRVIYPLMPKGVEHRPISNAKDKRYNVIYPLMPKGVEHARQAIDNGSWFDV